MGIGKHSGFMLSNGILESDEMVGAYSSIRTGKLLLGEQKENLFTYKLKLGNYFSCELRPAGRPPNKQGRRNVRKNQVPH